MKRFSLEGMINVLATAQIMEVANRAFGFHHGADLLGSQPLGQLASSREVGALVRPVDLPEWQARQNQASSLSAQASPMQQRLHTLLQVLQLNSMNCRAPF